MPAFSFMILTTYGGSKLMNIKSFTVFDENDVYAKSFGI